MCYRAVTHVFSSSRPLFSLYDHYRELALYQPQFQCQLRYASPPPSPCKANCKKGTSHLFKLGFGSFASKPSLSRFYSGGHLKLERAELQAPIGQDGVRYLSLPGKGDLNRECGIMQRISGPEKPRGGAVGLQDSLV